MTRFLGMPTRGGWLTLVNCGFWVLVALYQSSFGPWLFLPYVLFALPLALPVGTLLSMVLPRREETIAWCILVGLNSVAWGYAVSWILSAPARVRGRRARQQGRCTGCGYDLRATPDRCPECGLMAD